MRYRHISIAAIIVFTCYTLLSGNHSVEFYTDRADVVQSHAFTDFASLLLQSIPSEHGIRPFVSTDNASRLRGLYVESSMPLARGAPVACIDDAAVIGGLIRPDPQNPFDYVLNPSLHHVALVWPRYTASATSLVAHAVAFASAHMPPSSAGALTDVAEVILDDLSIQVTSLLTANTSSNPAEDPPDSPPSNHMSDAPAYSRTAVGSILVAAAAMASTRANARTIRPPRPRAPRSSVSIAPTSDERNAPQPPNGEARAHAHVQLHERLAAVAAVHRSYAADLLSPSGATSAPAAFGPLAAAVSAALPPTLMTAVVVQSLHTAAASYALEAAHVGGGLRVPRDLAGSGTRGAAPRAARGAVAGSTNMGPSWTAAPLTGGPWACADGLWARRALRAACAAGASATGGSRDEKNASRCANHDRGMLDFSTISVWTRAISAVATRSRVSDDGVALYPLLDYSNAVSCDEDSVAGRVDSAGGTVADHVSSDAGAAGGCGGADAVDDGDDPATVAIAAGGRSTGVTPPIPARCVAFAAPERHGSVTCLVVASISPPAGSARPPHDSVEPQVAPPPSASAAGRCAATLARGDALLGPTAAGHAAPTACHVAEVVMDYALPTTASFVVHGVAPSVATRASRPGPRAAAVLRDAVVVSLPDLAWDGYDGGRAGVTGVDADQELLRTYTACASLAPHGASMCVANAAATAMDSLCAAQASATLAYTPLEAMMAFAAGLCGHPSPRARGSHDRHGPYAHGGNQQLSVVPCACLRSAVGAALVRGTFPLGWEHLPLGWGADVRRLSVLAATLAVDTAVHGVLGTTRAGAPGPPPALATPPGVAHSDRGDGRPDDGSGVPPDPGPDRRATTPSPTATSVPLRLRRHHGPAPAPQATRRLAGALAMLSVVQVASVARAEAASYLHSLSGTGPRSEVSTMHRVGRAPAPTSPAGESSDGREGGTSSPPPVTARVAAAACPCGTTSTAHAGMALFITRHVTAHGGVGAVGAARHDRGHADAGNASATEAATEAARAALAGAVLRGALATYAAIAQLRSAGAMMLDDVAAADATPPRGADTPLHGVPTGERTSHHVRTAHGAAASTAPFAAALQRYTRAAHALSGVYGDCLLAAAAAGATVARDHRKAPSAAHGTDAFPVPARVRACVPLFISQLRAEPIDVRA